jgi:hypothetical protein
VQNCDEYYSYNELTGLARTGEEEVVRRDPWELVIEAVQKMRKSDDVMRSDRLKQVMQSIDPNFDERQVGCNRFSKFVVEAEKRGLLNLTKMDNGQYAVDVGPNANVPADHQVPAESHPSVSKQPATAPSEKRPTQTHEDRDKKARTLTLSESFDLLKRALVAAGAVGDEATVADRARNGMIEIHRSDSDPIFEVKRFQRMLRQAHDAGVIELIKSEGDDYMLKLGKTASEEMERAKPKVQQHVEAPEAGDDTDTAQEPKKTTKRKTAKKKGTAKDVSDAAQTEEPKKQTKRKTVKKKAATAKTKAVDEDAAVSEEEPKKTAKRKTTKRKTTKRKTAEARAEETEQEQPQAVEAKPETATDTGSAATSNKASPPVNTRFRRGGRSSKPRLAAAEKPSDSETKQEPLPEQPSSPKVSTGARTLGMRSGRKAAKHARKKDGTEQATQLETPEVTAQPEQTPVPETVEVAEPLIEPEENGASLFKKVTAAFQRAMGSGKEERE